MFTHYHFVVLALTLLIATLAWMLFMAFFYPLHKATPNPKWMIICLITSDIVGKCKLPSYNSYKKTIQKSSVWLLPKISGLSKYPEPRSALDWKFKVNIKQLQYTEMFSNECLPLSLKPKNTSTATVSFLMNSFYSIVRQVLPTVFIPHITWWGWRWWY